MIQPSTSEGRTIVRPDTLPSIEHLSDPAVRILRAGLELFAARGYHATSIREIATAAGLPTASLYTSFASKEAILTELVTIAHDIHHRALMKALLSAGSDPRDQLRNLIQAHVATHCRWTQLAAVATRDLVHLPEASNGAPLALRASSVQLFVGIIDRGLEQGVFSIANRDITLPAISSLGIAVIDWYPAQAERYTPEVVGTTYADLALLMAGATA